MLKSYLCFTLCLQFALITAGGGRHGGGGTEREHVHIKVHVPELNRKHTHHHRIYHRHHRQHHPISSQQQQIHYTSKKLMPTTKATTTPYDFDFYGLAAEGNVAMLPEQLMGNGGGGGGNGVVANYGPVLFGNDISASSAMQAATQFPISNKKLMHQLFAPEIMSALTGEHISEDYSSELSSDASDDDVGGGSGVGGGANSVIGHNDFLHEYFMKLNKPKNKPKPTRHTAKKTSPTKSTHKRKKYGNTGIGESYPTQPLQQQQQQQQYRNYYQQQRLQQQTLGQHYNNPLRIEIEDDSDELDTVEDISASATTSSSSSSSSEDMTTAFNGLHPISYQDTYGAFVATAPLTTTMTTAAGSSNLNYQTTSPTKWREYQHQQQQQQQRLEEQQYKQKSKQTQFVPQLPLIRLATSSTSPISSSSSGFDDSSAAAFATYDTSSLPSSSPSMSLSSIGPTAIATSWSSPYDFVQQSHHQQQLDAQQLQLQQQQQQKRQQKQTRYKKRKNRNKRKRNRIIVQ